jgi:hypothetical protein
MRGIIVREKAESREQELPESRGQKAESRNG